MIGMKYNNKELPGEKYYREFFNSIENDIYDFDTYNGHLRTTYRYYQEWHMNIGQDIFMEDIDLLVTDHLISSYEAIMNIEYYDHKNYALIEMKHWRVKDKTIYDMIENSTANSQMATNANLPHFIVKYYPKQEFPLWGNYKDEPHWEFQIFAANKLAENYLFEQGNYYSEKHYVYFLYKLRGLKPSQELLDRYSNCQKVLLK